MAAPKSCPAVVDARSSKSFSLFPLLFLKMSIDVRLQCTGFSSYFLFISFLPQLSSSPLMFTRAEENNQELDRER
jgi:hypothetical protein